MLVPFWISPRICRTWAVAFLRLIGQRLDLAGHHRESLAVLAGPRGLDGGVQGQQVGLLGDVVDGGDDVADGLGLLGQHQDVLGRRFSTFSWTAAMACDESSTTLRPDLPMSRVRCTASPTVLARWAD